MRSRKLILVSWIVILIFLMIPLRVNLASDQSEGVIDDFSGDVKILRGAWWNFWGWKDVQRGQTLLPNDRIKVGRGSSLDITLADGSSIRLMEDTLVTIGASERFINDDGQVVISPSIKIKKGELWCKVKELFSDFLRFQVKTPNAVAGVRGTAFSVNVQKRITHVQVAEGLVEVVQRDSGQLVNVAAGYETKVIGKNSPSPPIPLNKEKGEKLKGWARGIEEKRNTKNGRFNGGEIKEPGSQKNEENQQAENNRSQKADKSNGTGKTDNAKVIEGKDDSPGESESNAD